MHGCDGAQPSKMLKSNDNHASLNATKTTVYYPQQNCSLTVWVLTNPDRSQNLGSSPHPFSFLFISPIFLPSRFLSGSVARKFYERFGL